MKCNIYYEIREGLFVAISTIGINFRQLPIDTQFLEISSNPLYYRIFSKAIVLLDRRHYCSHAHNSTCILTLLLPWEA